MIVVIADDLTGAAELAGIGWRFGLEVLMSTKADAGTTVELLVVTTDTRSTGEEEAVKIMQELTTRVKELQPGLIYKKTDSVLRGHVVAELTAQLEVLHQDRVLVVPANPHLGRTIKDGLYYFNAAPVHLSSFAGDPEFPVKSSAVTDMVRAGDANVRVVKPGETLPTKGIMIAEVIAQQDLATWAEQSAVDSFAAGASGFFTELLRRRLPPGKRSVKPLPAGAKRLFVSGTTFAKSTQSIRRLHQSGGAVIYLPNAIIRGEADSEAIQNFTAVASKLLSTKDYAVIAINEESTRNIRVTAAVLRERKALAVAEVLRRADVDELIIEGGSTAAAIISVMGYSMFEPVNELAPGVVRMRVKGTPFCMTVKPGSYNWPEGLWVGS